MPGSLSAIEHSGDATCPKSMLKSAPAQVASSARADGMRKGSCTASIWNLRSRGPLSQEGQEGRKALRILDMNLYKSVMKRSRGFA